MAVTLRPNEIKLRTQTGEYQSPVVLGDTTVADHVAQVNAAITAKGEETLESIPEDYTELSGEVAELRSAITEPTRNLWVWGDQEVTGAKTVTINANLPGGEGKVYTLSALVDKPDSTGNARMLFYKNSVSNENMLANPYIKVNSRNSVTFELTESADIIRVYSSASPSGTTPAVWTDIQLEDGSEATSYTPPLTAVDSVARKAIGNLNDDLDDKIATVNATIKNYASLKAGDAVVIANNTDYNTLTTPGNYRCTSASSAASMTHAPASLGHRLFVGTITNNWILQIAIISDSRDLLVKGRIRKDDGITWYPTDGWVTFLNDDDVIAFVRGDITQSLTDTQKTRARDNIDAADRADVIEMQDQLQQRILLTNQTYVGDGVEFAIELPDYNVSMQTPIICCDATFIRSSGVTDYPRVRIGVKNNRDLTRYSTWYKIGREVGYEIREWRAPAYQIFENKAPTIYVTVPVGCTLTIRRMWYRYDSSIDRTVARGATFFARAGTCSMVPELTIPAMQMANRHGYDAFTVIPKISSDGVWFAYHDDTFDINTTELGNPNGTAITDTTYNEQRFDNIPFSYLDQFTYRPYGELFRDVHVMRLDECFEYLAKTGMKLRFSMHPAAGINIPDKLSDLRRLVDKYGLLKDLTIIVNDIASIFQVFGNDIGGYCFPNRTGSNWEGETKRVDVALTDAIAAKSTYNITVPISCGLWSDSLFADTTKAEKLVSDILDEGFAAGVFVYTFTGTDGASHNRLWSEDMRWLMSIGVTEFTDGFNTSIGLNW